MTFVDNDDTASFEDFLRVLSTTRAIRRYTTEPIPTADLNRILFAATRAPTGSNRQLFRFVILDQTSHSKNARLILGRSARSFWKQKYADDGYSKGSGEIDGSPKNRLARAMQEYVDDFEASPVVILPCIIPHGEVRFFDGASIYPACQNLLLAARAMGYGGVMTGFNWPVNQELHVALSIPDDVVIAATLTLGRARGHNGLVRRRPLTELVYEGSWGREAKWTLDLSESTHSQAGPPK